jgi:hypothetical protein
MVDTTAGGSDVVRLTEWTSCGGCAAKWGATALAGMVAGIGEGTDPALLVGLAPFDDAAVYRVSDDLALVSTTDFFPPLVDDPGDFGAIAAANACSDVFAMGGRVVTALNLSAFPERLPVAAIAAVLGAPPRSWPRPAAPWPVGTPSAPRSRSSAWPCRGSCTRTASSPRAGPAPVTPSCSRSRSARGSSWPGATRPTRPSPPPACVR